jgi:hypothetical protein
MAFTEDLSVFLDPDGFGVPVTAGAVSGVGILDLESELGVGGEITFIGATVAVATATFGHLSNGNAIAVDGVNYKVVMQPQRLGGGAFCRVPLIKVDPDEAPVLILDGDFLPLDPPPTPTELPTVILNGDFL